MTTTTTNYDLTKLSAMDRGRAIIGIAAELGVKNALTLCADQCAQISKANTIKGRKPIKSVAFQHDKTGAVSGALHSETSDLKESMDQLLGMLEAVGTCFFPTKPA